MTEIEIVRAWRRLMLNEDGTLKPDAETVMRDLEKVTGWMVISLPLDSVGRVDPYKTAASQATRAVFAHAKKRLYHDIKSLLNQERKNG